MNEAEKHELVELVERGDRYALMLAVVRGWVAESHPEAAHAAVYAYHKDDTPPVRVTIPSSASSVPSRR